MKNSFFISIYLVVLLIVLVIQAFKIKQLEDNIKESDRIKKEIYKLGDRISIINDKQEVYDFILNTALNVIQKGNKGSILIQGEDDLFHFKTIRGFNKVINLEPVKKDDLSLYKYNGCKDIAILNYKSGENNEVNESVLISPINSEGKLIGVINIYAGEGAVKFTDEDVKTLRYIRHELEITVKNFLIQDRLKHIATHDELTNLYNRRSFNEVFEKEIENVKRYGTESFLAIIDLDDFKKINDTFGHKAGDEALIRMATAMRTCLSSNDTYARMSGDEFIIIFRGGTLDDAEQKLSSIRRMLKDDKGTVEVDFTYGLASINSKNGFEKDEILSTADKRMYIEKKRKKVGR